MSKEFLSRFMLERQGEVNDLGTMFGVTMQPVAQQFPVSAAQPQQPVAMPQGPLTPDMVVAGLVQRGVPEIVARASASEFNRESGLDPSINERNPIVPGSRGGYGLAQWTGPRRQAYESFAASKGVDPADPNAQLDFYVSELNGPEKAAYDAALKAGNEEEAASILKTKFFRPAIGRQGYGDNGGGLFNQGQPPNMADYNVPDQPEARGFLKSLQAAMHGEAAPELDWRSALQGLGVGLSQLSHGESPDLSRIQDRQLVINERNRQEYQQKRERAAAAQYAAAQGDKAAADALMSGGMDLGQYFSKEQINDQRLRWATEDARSQAGKQALYNYGASTLGLSDAAAGAFAENPGAYVAGQQLQDAHKAVAEAKQKEDDTRQALAQYYGGMPDQDSQHLAMLLRNPNIDFDVINKSFDLSQGMLNMQLAKKADARADKASNLDQRRFGLDVAQTDASISSANRAGDLAERQFTYQLYKDDKNTKLAQQAHAEIVNTLQQGDATSQLAAQYAQADPSLSIKDALDAARQPAPPAVQQNYDRAVQQGFQGTIMDYQLALSRASAPTTTIDMKGETKWAEKSAELFAKKYDDLSNAALSADDTMGMLNTAEEAMKGGVRTGFGGEAEQSLRKLALTLGVGDADKVASGELLKSITSRMALMMRSPDQGMGMPGAMSDADRQYLIDAQVGLGTSPEGNQKLLTAFKAMQQRKIDLATMADDYIARNGVLDAGFNKLVRQFVKANPLGKTKPAPADSGMPDFDTMNEQQLDEWIASHGGAK